jgi:hypothetical protein
VFHIYVLNDFESAQELCGIKQCFCFSKQLFLLVLHSRRPSMTRMFCVFVLAAELMAGHAPSDPARARLLRCASEDLSHAGGNLPQGPPLDISASLFGQASTPNIRFPPGANANMPGRQQVVVDQLQQQQQQQRLLSGLLTSNMPLGPAQSQALQVGHCQL